jgi:sn-glycerol 3-phosphate transport system substrate-binding protein
VSVARRVFLAGSAALLAGCARRATDRTEATLWFSYGGKNREVLLSLVERFNAQSTRHRIVPTYQGDYFEALAKIRTALAAGVAPTFTHVVGEVVPYLDRANVLERLDDYDGARDLGLLRGLSQAGSFLGGDSRPLVAIPFNRSTPIMYMNARLTDGAPAPRTWDELRDAARRLTTKDGATSRFGFGVPIDWWFWVAMVGQAGGSLLDDEGRAVLGGEAGVEALSYWQELVDAGLMRPPAGRDYNAWQVTNQDFLAGRVAITWNSTAFLRYLEENASFPVVAAPLPGKIRRAVPTGGTHFVILRGAPEPEKQAAWTFLRFMCEPEQTIEWATRTGYLPVTTRAVERLEAEGFYRAHPNDHVALAQLADVQPWPWSPELFRIQRDVIAPRLEEAVLTRRNAREVLDEARRIAQEPS